MPAIQTSGCSAAAARPPSSGTTGSRLKRFRKNAREGDGLEQPRVASRVPGRAPRRRRPSRAAGLRGPTFASIQAFRGSPRMPITAPRNGTNRMGLVAIPSWRSAIACPSSCTNRSATKSAREAPAPEQGVGPDRDDHRARRREVLRLEAEQEEELRLRRELRDQEREAADRRDQAPERVAQAGARMDRSARRRRGRRGARRKRSSASGR